jgi:hypothetical protein
VRVKFNKKYTQAEYDNLAVKDEGTIYFVSDTRKIFVGNTEYFLDPKSEGVPVEYEKEIDVNHKVRRVQSEDGSYFRIAFLDGVRDPNSPLPEERQFQWSLLHRFEFGADGWITIDGVRIIDSNGAVMIHGDQTIYDTKVFDFDIQVPNAPKTLESAVSQSWVRAEYDQNIADIFNELLFKSNTYYAEPNAKDLGELVVGNNVRELRFIEEPTFDHDGVVNLRSTRGDEATFESNHWSIIVNGKTIYVGGSKTWASDYSDDVFTYTKATRSVRFHSNTLVTKMITPNWNELIGNGGTFYSINPAGEIVDCEYNYKFITAVREELHDNQFIRLLDVVDYYGTKAEIEAIATPAEGAKAVAGNLKQFGIYENSAWVWTAIPKLNTGYMYEVRDLGTAGAHHSGHVTFNKDAFEVIVDDRLIADYDTINQTGDVLSVAHTPGSFSVAGITGSFNGSADVEVDVPRLVSASLPAAANKVEFVLTDQNAVETKLNVPEVDRATKNPLYLGHYEQVADLPVGRPNGSYADVAETNTEWKVVNFAWVDTLSPYETTPKYTGGQTGIISAEKYARLLDSIYPPTIRKQQDLSSQTDGTTTVFTLTEAIGHYYDVQLNGLEQQSGKHFTYHPTNLTIEFVTPPSANSDLVVKYFSSLSMAAIDVDVSIDKQVTNDSISINSITAGTVTSSVMLTEVTDSAPGIVVPSQKLDWDSKMEALPDNAEAGAGYVATTAGWQKNVAASANEVLIRSLARQMTPDTYVTSGLVHKYFAESNVSIGHYDETADQWTDIHDGVTKFALNGTPFVDYALTAIDPMTRSITPVLDIHHGTKQSGSFHFAFEFTAVAIADHILLEVPNFFRVKYNGLPHNYALQLYDGAQFVDQGTLPRREKNVFTVTVDNDKVAFYANGEENPIEATAIVPVTSTNLSLIPVVSHFKLYSFVDYDSVLSENDVLQNALSDNIRYGLGLPLTLFDN